MVRRPRVRYRRESDVDLLVLVKKLPWHAARAGVIPLLASLGTTTPESGRTDVACRRPSRSSPCTGGRDWAGAAQPIRQSDKILRRDDHDPKGLSILHSPSDGFAELVEDPRTQNNRFPKDAPGSRTSSLDSHARGLAIGLPKGRPYRQRSLEVANTPNFSREFTVCNNSLSITRHGRASCDSCERPHEFRNADCHHHRYREECHGQ